MGGAKVHQANMYGVESAPAEQGPCLCAVRHEIPSNVHTCVCMGQAVKAGELAGAGKGVEAAAPLVAS